MDHGTVCGGHGQTDGASRLGPALPNRPLSAGLRCDSNLSVLCLRNPSFFS